MIFIWYVSAPDVISDSLVIGVRFKFRSGALDDGGGGCGLVDRGERCGICGSSTTGLAAH